MLALIVCSVFVVTFHNQYSNPGLPSNVLQMIVQDFSNNNIYNCSRGSNKQQLQHLTISCIFRTINALFKITWLMKQNINFRPFFNKIHVVKDVLASATVTLSQRTLFSNLASWTESSIPRYFLEGKLFRFPGTIRIFQQRID